LNNEYLGADGQRHAIPPTLLISALGIIDDVNGAVTMDLKRAGNFIYRVGIFARAENFVPPLSPETPRIYRALHQATRAGLVRACHDLSEGGLAVSAAEMCIGGRLGVRLEIGDSETLFGETNGCLLVEVEANHCAAFENYLEEVPHSFTRLGHVTENQKLEILCADEKMIALNVGELADAFNQPKWND
jgi:phosphoribosylformylglycinamidine synthase